MAIVTDKTSVRILEPSDRAGWELLWRGYQSHLGTKVPDSVVENTWEKLMDERVALTGMVALVDTFLMAGIAHVSFSPSSWSKGPLCHLQDLFVAENQRGRGAGHALVDAVFNMADKEKCSQVFWHLNRSDFRAKLLFDDYNAGPEGQLVQVRRKLSR
ncbi:MAG TPA: GNAT family N-acetyltransferase [Rhizobiales bacterium]|nr:GNAT family N-acetyltransferase [Hyphomicrobiales bacterium]